VKTRASTQVQREKGEKRDAFIDRVLRHDAGRPDDQTA